ncbi:MAG: PKD domain-containing protein, partial [Patescibacteria group bacterium]
MKSSLLLSLLFAFVLAPATLFAATADLGISASNIRFSEDALYAGETVRLYATVRNYGEVDIAAKVIFYQGAVLIGSSQTISVLANGGSDDVYVDYDVPEGTFNIRAVIQGQDPDDENAANDEAITELFTSIRDADHDGVVDDEDNCVDDENLDQTDSDGDDRGDVCDDDRDEDGVSNGSDAYPDDASKSANPIAVSEEPVVVEEPVFALEPVAIDVPVSTSVQAVAPVDNEPIGTSAQVPQENPGIFGFGTLSISPYAQFSYRRIDWRTYEFTALPSEGEGEVTYGWDFGDGATSVQQTLVHAFPDAGQYVVTLAVVDEVGNMVSDAETFDISFFHLRNPWIQATLAVLFFVLLFLF